MNRNNFYACAQVLRDYADWDKSAYALGMDFTNTAPSKLAELVELLMCDFNPNWAFDEKLEINWLIEWTYSPDGPNLLQTRHGREFHLHDAGALYNFLVFMNEHGWED